MMNPTLAVRNKVVSIGNRLVKGPFSIRPPDEIDDYGWLECTFRIVSDDRQGKLEAVALYVDDSMNREEAFLPPMIRHYIWDRTADSKLAFAGEITWPTTAPRLSYIHSAIDEVNELVRTVESQLKEVPYEVFGLCTDRSTPDVSLDPRGSVTLFVSNGLQQIEYVASTELDADLIKSGLRTLASLLELIEPIELDGWRESYDGGIAMEGGSRWWHYRPM